MFSRARVFNARFRATRSTGACLLAGLLLAGVATLGSPIQARASAPQLGLPQRVENGWMIRLNHPKYAQIFHFSTSEGHFVAEAGVDDENGLPGHISFHRALPGPVSTVSFVLEARGATRGMPIALYDAAANELWRSDGQEPGTRRVTLEDVRARGHLVFRVWRGDAPAGASYRVTDLQLTGDASPPVVADDGFILIDSFAELRGYAVEDSVRVRLRPGTYRLDQALYHHFLEFTGTGSHYDLSGVRIQASTELFSRFGVVPGDGGFYSVIDLSGDGTVFEGGFVETYGDRPGIQSRNKIFNITGRDVTLRNTNVHTAGSSPWGYGSLFGISGDPVRKMNGIRIGAPADGVRLIGCTVHMRAMGHGIFVQGAVNTLIQDCKVDGLLRPTNDILAETSGIAFDRGFVIRGSGEGVPPGPGNRIPRDEMVSLSEDGIRLYPSGGGVPTGRTTIINSTVTGMRRGICTAFGAAPNRVIGSVAIDNVAAGFHVGSNDEVVGGRANARYAEALTIPNNGAENATVDLEILDSREGLANDLLAKINGRGHLVVLRVSRDDYVPEEMVIELGSNRGYLGSEGGYGANRPDGVASNITLHNDTPATVVVTNRATDVSVHSTGPVQHEP